MKLLTVILVCISVYCVRGYTIFPLPGQSAPVNPKFGRFEARPLSSAQSVTATKIVPFLSTFPPLPSTSYQQSRVSVPVVPNTPTPAPSKPLFASSYQTSKAPEVRIAPTLPTVSSYASTTEAPKLASSVPSRPTPPGSISVVSTLDTDLLPPHESAVPETKPKIVAPIKPEIEAPARDLLPPKLS